MMLIFSNENLADSEGLNTFAAANTMLNPVNLSSMNKFPFLFAVAFAALAFTACNSGETETTDAAADTTAVEEVAVEETYVDTTAADTAATEAADATVAH